ncbi:MAG: chemotaxis protein CheW [Burkholderiales bacterium]
MKTDSLSDLFLVFRSDLRLCALPLGSVTETMRPLPIEPMPEMPVFLLGVSIIRGAIVPVVDVARLLGLSTYASHARFVTLKLGDRSVAFAVDDVIGIRRLASETTAVIPPLLSAADAGVIDEMTTLDAELIVVLQAAHLIPDSVWEALDLNRTTQ